MKTNQISAKPLMTTKSIKGSKQTSDSELKISSDYFILPIVASDSAKPITSAEMQELAKIRAQKAQKAKIEEDLRCLSARVYNLIVSK